MALTAASCTGGRLSPASLMCEYQTNPGAVDVPAPRLSWVNLMPEGATGLNQVAWQVQVASSAGALRSGRADIWDSGRVEAASAPFVNYGGPAAEPAQRLWWRVRVWDSEGRVSRWSDAACWVAGYSDASQWKARWIGAPWDGEEPRDIQSGLPIYATMQGDPSVGDVQNYAPSSPAPMIRKKFTVRGGVESAHLFISGLGYCEPYFNGRRLGDDLLSPNQTDYTGRVRMDLRRLPMVLDTKAHSVFYLGYDLTDLIHEGDNAVGCILGNGFFNSAHIWTAGYGSPRVIAQIEIRYKDGSCETVVSDESWKVKESAVRHNDVFGGEVYDARYETECWCEEGFDDSSWVAAVPREAPDGDLRAQMGPCDKVIETFEPASIAKTGEKSYLVTFPEEISGRISLKNIQGAAGDTLRINYHCTVQASYNYNGESVYVCSGSGRGSYAPHFDWYVFHSATIENWTGELTSADVVAEAVSSDVRRNSGFSTSDTLINAISKIWVRTQKNNMHGGVPSDCPHRERGPYTGDGQIASAMVMHNFDGRAFYNKWLKDISNAQDASTGYVPNGAPWEPGCGGGVAWGAAMTIIPWEYYLAYGDLQLLSEHYAAAKAQTDYMSTWETPYGTMLSKAFDDSFIMNLGEHVPPFTAPSQEVMHTYLWWMCADYTSRMASALGIRDDAARYRALAEKIASAFHSRFYDPAEGSYGQDECDVLALRIGVPSAERERVIADLREKIAARGNHIVCGFVATRVFFEVLSECGLDDLAWEILHKDDYPSYGEMIKSGSTTMWEQWDAMHSHDHPMFGGGLVWFYRNLVGVRIDPEAPAYRHTFIKPYVPDSLDWAEYSLETVYGLLRVAWHKSDGALNVDLTIPEGCTASLTLPGPGQPARELCSGTHRVSTHL